MKVGIPQPLRSYTGEEAQVDIEGDTLATLLMELDHRYPGIRFRMIDEQDQVRPHMRIFVNGRKVRDLATTLEPGDEIHILQALSGG